MLRENRKGFDAFFAKTGSRFIWLARLLVFADGDLRLEATRASVLRNLKRLTLKKKLYHQGGFEGLSDDAEEWELGSETV